jgi:hypothetical protein
MTADISIALSIVALLFSMYVFIINRQKDKRDILIKMHEMLTSDRHQKGRYLLFEKITDETSVERLSGEDYRDINGAISGFSLLGLYVQKGYVNKADVLDAWDVSIARAWEAARPFLAHREHKHGYNPHIGFEPLARDAQKHLEDRGISLKYIAWRRTEDTERSE